MDSETINFAYLYTRKLREERRGQYYCGGGRLSVIIFRRDDVGTQIIRAMTSGALYNIYVYTLYIRWCTYKIIIHSLRSRAVFASNE